MDLLLQTLVQGLLVGGAYALVALGMGLTYNVSGIVNFAHGDYLTLAMFLAFGLQAAWALDPYVSVVITFPLLCAAGAVTYHFLLRPVARSHALVVIQLTLGIAFMLQNGLLMTFGGQPLRTPSAFEASILVIGDMLFVRAPQLAAFAVSLALAAALYGVLNFTETGRRIRAVHQNPRAAALMGIDVPRVRTLTFAAGIGILALAGALLLPGTTIWPTQGLRFTVIALMALTLGGLTDFAGIYLGALVIGVAEAVGTVYVSGTSGMILPYAIFVATLLLRPQGLFGRAP
jgi:branched-chain amino acid transport system permease protein